MTITMQPIGYVRSAQGEPREDSWGEAVCEIELDGKVFAADAVAGLTDFSHIEVLFLFDPVMESSIVRGSRRPREILLGLIPEFLPSAAKIDRTGSERQFASF